SSQDEDESDDPLRRRSSPQQWNHSWNHRNGAFGKSVYDRNTQIGRSMEASIEISVELTSAAEQKAYLSRSVSSRVVLLIWKGQINRSKAFQAEHSTLLAQIGLNNLLMYRCNMSAPPVNDHAKVSI
ncbi:unnamed protein product, partial [Nesidiocoris tenuis]